MGRQGVKWMFWSRAGPPRWRAEDRWWKMLGKKGWVSMARSRQAAGLWFEKLADRRERNGVKKGEEERGKGKRQDKSALGRLSSPQPGRG